MINAELSGWQGQWRRTLESVKASLADLEQACESAIDAREAEVAGVIENIVETATAQADAAAAQTRAQAQIEIVRLEERVAELQAAVESLQRDLDAEREGVKSLETRLDMNVADRLRAETERDETRRELDRQVTAAESRTETMRSERDAFRRELSALRQQHETAVAERSKLASAFQAIQQVLAQGMSATAASSKEHTESPVSARSEAVNPVAAIPDALALVPTPLADATKVAAEADPEVVEDIKRVLEQVEAIYQLDLNSGRSGTELVDSLTGSLRYARSVIVVRWHRDGFDAEGVFDAQIAALLDLTAGSSFGRHLSIAACDLRKPVAPPTQVDSASGPETIS